MIFLDQPVGSGFSYSRTPLVDKVSDTGEVKRIHEFLQKVLINRHRFLWLSTIGDLFISGLSQSTTIFMYSFDHWYFKYNYKCHITLTGFKPQNVWVNIDKRNYLHKHLSWTKALVCYVFLLV